MRVQIMGAGALGCLFGYLIQRSGFEVTFVARGKQLEALKRGLRVSGLLNDFVSVNVSDKPVSADVTFLTVKAYDTEVAAKALSRVECGIVCSLQNGIGNEEILAKYVKRVVGGVTTYASNLVDYGHIEYAGEGVTFVGKVKGDFEDAITVAEVLKASGIKVEVVEDIREKIWVKAVINAAINPITAILGVRNGVIAEVEEIWEVAKRIAEEGERVMRALGFNVSGLAGVVREVAKRTGRNKSSMLQDLERGRRTEIDFINGAIVREAERLGIEVPYTKAVYMLLKGVERVRALQP